MATTPPMRIISVQEPPPTPRHGAAHDNFEPRFPTRSSQRIASREAKTTPEPQSGPRALRSATTPESKRLTSQQARYNLSPPLSPQQSPKHSSVKRVQVFSPNSPSSHTRSHDTSSSNPSFTSSFTSSGNQTSFLSSSTVMTTSKLPTPAKTPRKKAVPNLNAAARALFREPAIVSDEIMPTPKKNRKSTRNGVFAMGNFAVESGTGTSQLQIFTDSRDNVPERDTSDDNPFLDHAPAKAGLPVKQVDGTSKRRKLTTDRKKDAQVEEAIKNDEGMVYVFRGKKVFKRFDDGVEEEDATIDPDDLGLLEHTDADVEALKLLKPLTRRSVRPTRLFQTEEQKRIREAERAEEEATDIDEDSSKVIAQSSVRTTDLVPTTRQLRSTTAPGSTETPNGHALDKAEDANTEGASGGQSPMIGRAKKSKKGSPFDSWKRVKAGAAADSTVDAAKGRKRTSSALDDGEQLSAGKKLRSR